MEPWGWAGITGGTWAREPSTCWDKVAESHWTCLWERAVEPCVSGWHVCQGVTLLPLPSWLLLGQDELCPQPVLSWAEQAGTGAERAWEQHG